MNRHTIIKAMASKLYVNAVDECFLTAVIAVAALQWVKKHEASTPDNEYMSPDVLTSYYA